MSNWFEDNPTRSVLGWTLFVATATWAISTFVIDENKVNLYRAQKENAESVSKNWEAKLSVVTAENERLRATNERYLGWLLSEPKSLPALERRIGELEKERTELQKAAKVQPAQAPDKEKPVLHPLKQPYVFSKQLRLGEAFIDPKTNATLGLSRINPDYTANVHFYSPYAKPIDMSSAKPGNSWEVRSGGKLYKLTLEKVNWLTDSALVTIVELPEK